MHKLAGVLTTALALLVIPQAAMADAALDNLARNVERAESIRAVKNLQRTYAQYSQYGLWDQMAALFSDDASFDVGQGITHGRKAIAALLTNRDGGGEQGLRSGQVHTPIIEEPVVNLSADGQTAKGRWYGFFLLGDGNGNATIEGGAYENEYVKQGSGWKISSFHFYPQYTGPYETGWVNWKGQDLPIVPYHFNGDSAGIPIPPPIGAAPHSDATLAQLEKRIDVLNGEDKVRNLQAAYGYYVNRRMWDDVTDLFSTNSIYEVGGVGLYEGKKGVRKALERMGPAGLSHGVLNDRLQLDTVVTITPGGNEAHARGFELGMLGEADKGTAFWEVSVFDNRFVKENGIWKVREMRIFPLLRSDYHLGWGKSRITETAPTGALAPDHPVPDADVGDEDHIIPAFVALNPGDNRPVRAPLDKKFVAVTPLTGPIPAPPVQSPGADLGERLADATRRLTVSTAYDGAENVSSAYGEYADDYQWTDMAKLFGKQGAKEVPFAGYYSGAARIAHATFLEWGDAEPARAGVSFHWRVQPVINVAPDGRSASVRTYLFQPRTAKEASHPGAFYGAVIFGAMYPDDQMNLEDGIWRIWNLSLDEPYFSSPDWKGGWSAAKEHPRRAMPPPARLPTSTDHVTGAALVAKFPPDVLLTALGAREEHFRGGTGEPWDWPMILPMWWGYRNPVSGRTPENFLPDCVPCDYDPNMSLARHGYLLPPTGPQDATKQ